MEEVFIYANINDTYAAPRGAKVFESREAVNAYLKAAYDYNVLCTMDFYGGKKCLDGIETLDEYRTRVWHDCVGKMVPWGLKDIADDYQLALKEREERRNSRRWQVSTEPPDDF